MVHSHVRAWLRLHLLSNRNNNPVNSVRVFLSSGISPDDFPAPFILFRYQVTNQGFSLVITYVAGSTYSSTMFGFLIMVFTVQYYFIIKSFWVGVGLGNDNYTYTLGQGPYFFVRLHTNDWRLNSSYTTEVGLTEAIVCAFSMLVAYMAVAGRIGAFQVFVLCFFGVFFYEFN